MCVLGVFGVWKREMCRDAGQRANFRKNVVLLVYGVPGAIYSPDMLFEAAALKGQKKCGS